MRLKDVGSEVLRAAAVDLAGKALSYMAFALLAAFALLVWRGGSVPAWTLALAIALACIATILARQRQRNAFEGHEGENNALQGELARHTEYSRHLQNSLDALQRVISKDIDTEIPYFLEQAVLDPARGILSEKPAEEIRLSVLLPSEEDPLRWSMTWAAGHSMIGQLKYNQPIAETLARHAYERGETQYWPDTEAQTEFQQNPHASAPTLSLISIPIREGDNILGVFNAVSSERHAFDDAEQTFLASLAGVIAVAVSVWRQPAEP